MNRTLERALAIIALILQGLVIIFGLLFYFVFDNFFPEELPGFFELWYGWFVFGIHIIGGFIGIVALKILNHDNQKAALLFLGTGIGMLIFTLGATLIQSALFIVVGVLCMGNKTTGKSNQKKFVIDN